MPQLISNSPLYAKWLCTISALYIMFSLVSPKYDIEHVGRDYGQIRMRAAEDLKEILTFERV